MACLVPLTMDVFQFAEYRNKYLRKVTKEEMFGYTINKVQNSTSTVWNKYITVQCSVLVQCSLISLVFLYNSSSFARGRGLC